MPRWLELEVGGAPRDGIDHRFAHPKGCRVVGAVDGKGWIVSKKEGQKKLGRKVVNDSKCAGRSKKRRHMRDRVGDSKGSTTLNSVPLNWNS
jgi:hypothetical protein